MARPRGVWSDKAFRDALRKVVMERDKASGQKKIDMLARRLVESGLGGDTAAIKEAADRLDGKPNQTQIIDATVTNHMVMAPPPEKDADVWSQKHSPVAH
jgi:hypothetical protein